METITITHDALSAVEIMLTGCHDAFCDNATSYSCTEVEMLADVYRAFGRADWADSIIDQHATDDDEGDEHYGLKLRNEAKFREADGDMNGATNLRHKADVWEREFAEA